MVVLLPSLGAFGAAVNPVMVEGQMEGSAHMGTGYGLTEHMILSNEGRFLNDNMLDYKIIPASDTPTIEAVIVPTYEPTGP